MPDEFTPRKVGSSEELKFVQTIVSSHVTSLTTGVMEQMSESSVSPGRPCDHAPARALSLSLSKAGHIEYCKADISMTQFLYSLRLH